MVESPFQVLAQNWETITLGEAAQRGGGNVQTGPFGSQLHASDYVSEGVPSIMPQNIGDNRIIEEGIARIREADAARLSKYRLTVGDIVYSRRGDVERRSLVRSENDGWLCGTGCLRVRFGKHHVFPEYAAHYLGHPSVREWIVQHAVGATMPNLNTSILSAVPFVLPPMAVQIEIASALSALDDKIDLNRRMNETLEALAQAIFRDWFVDFGPVRRKMAGVTDPVAIMGGLTPDPARAAELAALFPDGFGEDELPVGWTLSGAGNWMDILDSKRVPLSSRQREERKGNIPYHGATGVMGVVDAHLFDEILLLIGEDGSVVRPDGRPFTQYVWGKIWVNNHAHVLRGKGITTEHLKCFFEHIDIAPFVTGAVQPKLNQANMKAIPFIAATDEIHRQFGELVEPLFARIRAAVEETNTLAETRDYLLPRLMSGEVRVGDAVLEIAA